MKIPEQVKRLGVVVGALVVVVVVTRFYVIPPSLIAREVHRSSTVAREVAKPVKFASAAVCQTCHDDIMAKKVKGYHRTLACETCHGPAVKHTDDPTAVKPPAPRDRKFCPVCHAYDPSRPTGFPQINPATHNPLKPCIACHNPHDPVPPSVPRECSACHGQIERTKAVSSHALLACTTCHRVPAEHRTSPRTVLPSKPQTREFCGTCHAKGGAEKPTEAKTAIDRAQDVGSLPERAPKVDLSTHGGSYLCWQCHYPHMPEGRV